MSEKQCGVCPVKSDEILRYALNGLEERGVLNLLPKEQYRPQAEVLGRILPDHYFPDVYLDLPLTDGPSGGIAAVFDCYDRCYVNYNTEGRYFGDLDIPSLTEPEDRDVLSGICFSGSERTRFSLDKGIFTAPDESLKSDPLLAGLSDLPIKIRSEKTADGCRISFTTGEQNPKEKFTGRPYFEQILTVLRAAGCSEQALRLLPKASYNCGVPFLHPEQGYMEWIVCLDVAAFMITKSGDRITDCHAVIGVCDRCGRRSGKGQKVMSSYQWHITDACDQRCKHCYLFAEDAALKCVTTPWDQLIHTLDEITKDAAARYALPMPVVSGGDPILHPDFWRFAEEIHRRGLRWFILGNPFHLNKENCKRLYELGCFEYQMSLDGLREFHDYMRKPGSYQTTLDTVALLNEAGIEGALMATASRQNLDDIIACMDIAVQYEASVFVFARYCATSPEKAKEAYPTPEEYRDFLLRYYKKKKDYEAKGCRTRFSMKEHLFTLLRFELGDFQISEYSKTHPDVVIEGCHLGQGVAILSNGDLCACRRMDSVIGNVNEDSVWNVLTSDLCRQYADVKNIKKCRDCELLNWCRGCRAVGFNATGDLQCADPMCWKS